MEAQLISNETPQGHHCHSYLNQENIYFNYRDDCDYET